MTREEAIEILWQYDVDFEPHPAEKVMHAIDMAIEALSAEAEPTVIRSKTLLPTKDFKEWAKRIKEENPNVIVIPCDAEVVSADAVPQLRQTDTLIIADALRYLAEDTERHELDRARAEKLREQILQYGASMCHTAEASQNLAKPNKALKGSDLISRQAAIEAVKELEISGVNMAFPNDVYNAGIDNATRVLGLLPSADRPPYRIDPYGTAWVIAHDGQDLDKVGRVILDNFPYAKTFYPDRPRGEWIETESDEPCWYRCSECARRTDEASDFCPNCGARMVGDNDE